MQWLISSKRAACSLTQSPPGCKSPLHATCLSALDEVAVLSVVYYQEDFALHLLTIPDQTLDLDLNRSLIFQKTLVYLCVQSKMPPLSQARKVPLHFRVVKELVRKGADIDLWDEDHHTPLCAAATQRHLPALRFFLEQYQARGGED